jgi:arginyl-tRNA synthetase
MKIQCLSRLADSFRASRSLDPSFDIPWEPCPAGMNGDLTVNCFRLAKALKGAPDALAAETAELLMKDPDVVSAEKIKAFVNITLKPAAAKKAPAKKAPVKKAAKKASK